MLVAYGNEDQAHPAFRLLRDPADSPPAHAPAGEASMNVLPEWLQRASWVPGRFVLSEN